MEFLGERYRLDELVAEAGRGILVILAAGAWTFLWLMLFLEAG